jgi:hypothetical protein
MKLNIATKYVSAHVVTLFTSTAMVSDTVIPSVAD